MYVLFRAIYESFQELYYEIAIRPRLGPALQRFSGYYRMLGPERREFKRKVWEFIRENEFVGREGVRVRLPLKCIIASHAVQLSFRLSEYAYSYYERIIIYRDYYKSRLTNRYHKGEVNPGLRLIVFSMKGISESLNRPDDGLNVMLHEFAHALWLEHLLMHKEYNVFDPNLFVSFQDLIRAEMQRYTQDETHFFRKYAFQNTAEFFAVAVENFFERPQAFNSALPGLFAALARLFRHNPLSAAGV